MNMMAIGFSLDWFLTIPGLLISGGVVLLFIALIIFIVTSTKSKRENKEEVEEVTPVTPEVDTMVTPVVSETFNTSVVEEVVPTETVDYDFIAATPVEPVAEEIVEEQQSVEMPEIVMPSLVAFEPENTFMPENTPIEETKVEEFPTYGFNPIVEEPIVIEEPTYLDPIAAPVVEPSIMEAPIMNNAVSEEPVVSIYGGIAPVVAPVKEPEHRQIYGGADPLEATQRMAPILPTAVYPEVMPIVNEVTLTEPAMGDFTFPDVTPVAYVEERAPYTVESPIPDVVLTQPEVVEPMLVQPIPVEVTEKIEEL